LSVGTVVIVNPSHVVLEVPLPGETVADDRALATRVCAEVRLLTMAVHGMGLTLMAQKAGGRGEPRVLATLNLATVRLEVRVYKLTVTGEPWSADANPKKEVVHSYS